MRNQIQKKVAIIAAIAMLSINANAQWTTTGAVIAPTDLTKNVSIGATTNGANFYVEKANAVTLGIKSQTAGATMFMDKGISTANAAFAYKLNGTTLWNTGLLGGNNYSVRNVVNNTFPLVVTQADMVGLGTVTPTAALHMQKAGLADVLIKSSGNGAQLTLDRAANGYEAVTRYTQTGVPQWKTGLTVNANGTPDYVVRNEINNSDALAISSSNFVTLPTGYLLLGSTNASVIKQSGNDLELSAYEPNSGTPGNVIIADAFGLFKAGNVGIGTEDPSRAKLVVEGNVGKTTAIFGQGSTGVSLIQDWPGIAFNSYFANPAWKSISAGYGGNISVDPTSGVMAFTSSSNATASDQNITGTTPMLIYPAGNVGINNPFVSASLDVGLRTGLSAAATFWGSNPNFGTHFCYGSNEDTYIRGGKTSSNVIIADLNTNVGVGTSTPAYKLDVCGTMRAKEVRVATGWCDYVFAEDYKLPALNDVEAFIKANKHLPDVTPGAIIESEGLEVGKTSAQMIKKIEELTLYVIELQKQVNELKCKK